MKEDLRSTLSRKMLKDALLKLMQNRKAYDINVRELCEKAGVNRSTFYRHYNNIADILEEIYDDIGKIIAETNTSASHDPAHTGNHIYKAIDFFDKHPEYDPLILDEGRFLQIFSERFKPLIADSINISKSGNENAYLIDYLLGGTFIIIRNWIENNRKESAKQIADTIFVLSGNTVSGH